MSDGSSPTLTPDLVLPAGCVGTVCQPPGKYILFNVQNSSDPGIQNAEAAVINALSTLMRICAFKSTDSGTQATYNAAAVAVAGILN